jgi:hypothetical protein
MRKRRSSLNPRWRVTFRGTLSEDAKAELAQAGIMLVSGRLRIAADGTEERLSSTVWVRAVDGTEAIMLVRTALAAHGSFHDFKADPVNYLMYLGILESEGSAIEAAADEVRGDDPRISSVVLSEPSKGSAELLLEIPADSQEDAIDQAKIVYADLRKRAGLQPAEPLYGFLGPTGQFPSIPVVSPPRHVELERRAQQLLEQGSYEYAVVAAQTACEVMAFEAITELLKAEGEATPLHFAKRWFSANRTFALKEDKQRDLWNVLAGDEIQKAPWWSAYQEHLVRRHGIIHRGTVPTKSEAEHSIQAASDFRAHVDQKLQEALPDGS